MSSQQLPPTGSTDAESREQVEDTLNKPPGPSETAAGLVWASDELMTRIYRLMKKHELVKWLVLDKAGYDRVSKEFYRHIDLKVVGQMVMKQCPMVSPVSDQDDPTRLTGNDLTRCGLCLWRITAQSYEDSQARQSPRLSIRRHS